MLEKKGKRLPFLLHVGAKIQGRCCIHDDGPENEKRGWLLIFAGNVHISNLYLKKGMKISTRFVFQMSFKLNKKKKKNWKSNLEQHQT